MKVKKRIFTLLVVLSFAATTPITAETQGSSFVERLRFDFGASGAGFKEATTGVGGFFGAGYALQDFNFFLVGKFHAYDLDKKSTSSLISSMFLAETKFDLFPIPVRLLGGLGLGMIFGEAPVIKSSGGIGTESSDAFLVEAQFGAEYPISQSVSVFAKAFANYAILNGYNENSSLPGFDAENAPDVSTDMSGAGIDIGLRFALGSTVPLRY